MYFPPLFISLLPNSTLYQCHNLNSLYALTNDHTHLLWCARDGVGIPDAVTLLCEYKVPLDQDKATSTLDAWCCSLSWLPSTSISTTTPTFYMSPDLSGCCIHAQVIAGCTNGQVFCLHWVLKGTEFDNSNPLSCEVSCVNGVTGVCSITGVSRVSGSVSEVVRVWEDADKIPVYSVACQSQVRVH